MPDPNILVAIATFNERDNLPSLIDAIEAALPTADVLVIDDNSPDGTGDWAKERAASDPRVRIIHRSGKLGLGTATFAAMRVAIDEGYDIVCTLDADWSHPPETLPELVALLKEKGPTVAIGSRYVRGGRIEGWPLKRHLASKLVNSAARVLLRLPTRDCSGAFRAYRVDALHGIEFDSMRGTGYAYLEEILWRLKRRGATFVELPITFTERRAGASKINGREVRKAIALLFRLGFVEWTGRGVPPNKSSS